VVYAARERKLDGMIVVFAMGPGTRRDFLTALKAELPGLSRICRRGTSRRSIWRRLPSVRAWPSPTSDGSITDLAVAC
jgi:hypothetical protein